MYEERGNLIEMGVGMMLASMTTVLTVGLAVSVLFFGWFLPNEEKMDDGFKAANDDFYWQPNSRSGS